jgi:hypothetical protein
LAADLFNMNWRGVKRAEFFAQTVKDFNRKVRKEIRKGWEET